MQKSLRVSGSRGKSCYLQQCENVDCKSGIRKESGIEIETEENEGYHVQHIHDTVRNQITIAHTDSHCALFSCG